MSKIIGIDLGTTNSAMAVMEGGDPTVITNIEGARTTPSIVAMNKNGERLAGQVAKRQAVINPDNTIFSVKRLIGRTIDDPEIKRDMELMPYEIVKADGHVKVKMGDKDYTPEEISAMILSKLKADAEKYLGETVTEAVITVPAYFNDAQRQATKDAGKIAGLEVKRIINEPTAAALAYGFNSKKSEKIVVYDFGGGTFDISVLEVGADLVEVKSTDGDAHMGGEDIDRKIVAWIGDEFKKESGLDVTKDVLALQRLKEAAEKGTVIQFLLSDAGQKDYWPTLKKHLKGKTLCFSHGFAITYKDQTGIIPDKDIDVVLVAPKGSGLSVRRNFVDGSGINSSIAVFQDATGKAWDMVKALGIAVGSGYLFPTTFEKEVYSDLTGERGILMGALAGVMEAQYNELRAHGHSPSEAFNETVEELTQSLIRLVGENGMDWMYANCSTTAQRGALDWKDKFRDATVPVFKDLYESVANGTEARITLDKNGQADYREKLEVELKTIHDSEMWTTGRKVRELRPENWEKGNK